MTAYRLLLSWIASGQLDLLC